MTAGATPPGPRDLPDHEVRELRLKAHRYALVIPVINEGERIRQQLARIAALSPPVDVVVADGGSTDGSLDDGSLSAGQVRALLTKRGPGRLSAQLRMAYAWCLDQQYDGVVTVDGNGKDGVEAIPRFVEMLDQGYDLVQGSRYLPAAVAENTPLDRKLAGRLLHAPVISLAAGYRYTDTTNGFRAYSARMLADPAVAPFRSVFDRYNLLFYLSVRGPRLGYRVTEIPVSRRYPKAEATPTKISGWNGRILILRELFGAVAGRYNPS
jgi:dolichol-phosphate mannosyltransferase